MVAVLLFVVCLVVRCFACVCLVITVLLFRVCVACLDGLPGLVCFLRFGLASGCCCGWLCGLILWLVCLPVVVGWFGLFGCVCCVGV